MQNMLWWIGDSHCPYNSGISTPQVRLLRAKTANKLTQELEEYTRHSMDHGPWTVGSRLQSQALSTQIETSNDPQNPQSSKFYALKRQIQAERSQLQAKGGVFGTGTTISAQSASLIRATRDQERWERSWAHQWGADTDTTRTSRRGTSGAPPAAARIAGSRRANEVDARSWPLEAEKIPSQSPQGLERSKPHPLQQNKRATNKEDIGTHTARRIHFKRTAALTERSEPRSLRYSTLTQDQATRDWFAIAGSISFADELHLWHAGPTGVLLAKRRTWILKKKLIGFMQL